jgi:malonate-semialdehyde dehydrogenase (acetylating)/methylmalonate-semialdehyde dehydrogenase
MKVAEHLVNGEIVSMGDPTQDVFNPSTGEVSKQVALATKTTVEKTITQRWLSSSIREGINFSFPS